MLSAGPTGKNNFAAEPEGFKLPLVRVWEALACSGDAICGRAGSGVLSEHS